MSDLEVDVWAGLRAADIALVRDALSVYYLTVPLIRDRIREFALNRPVFGLVVDQPEPAADEDL